MKEAEYNRCDNEIEKISTAWCYWWNCSKSDQKSTTKMQCPDCPNYCYEMHDTVCGSDMVTYPNMCVLKKTKCEQNLQNLTMTHYGKCHASSTNISSTIPAITALTECPESCMVIYQSVYNRLCFCNFS